MPFLNSLTIIGPVRADRASATRRAAGASSCASPTARSASRRARARSSPTLARPRLSAARPTAAEIDRADAVLRGRAHGGRVRAGIGARHRAAAGEPVVPVPRSSAIRPARRRRVPTASATSSSRPGCRSSSGAASPTTSCSTLAARGAAARAGRARAAGARGCWPIAEGRRAGEELRRPVAAAPQPRRARSPNANIFSDFDDDLRQSFRRETELLFESILREDRSALELLTRRLHVRQRAAGAGTTASRTSTATASGA